MSTVITPKMVASNVRNWRIHLGFKQHVIADELGMSREWSIKLENGQVDLKIKHLLIIAQVLGIALEDFFKEKLELTKQKSAPLKLNTI